MIAAITLLETALREGLDLPNDQRSRPISFRQMLSIAAQRKVLPEDRIAGIMEWLHIRNQLVHSQQAMQRSLARQIVTGVLKIVKAIGGRFVA